VSGSWDKTVRVWDATTNQEVVRFQERFPVVTAVAFSPDGDRLAAASTSEVIYVWDVATRRLVLSHGHHRSVYCVAFSPDGKLVASGDGEPEGKPGTVSVWNAQTGQTVFSYTAPRGSEVMFTGVAFSPDGSRVLAASPDQSVKVWDLTTGKEILWPKGRPGAVDAVAFSPDGKRLAGRIVRTQRGDANDSEVCVWDARTGQEMLRIHAHSNKVTGLAYSRDGKLLASASTDGTVTLWDAQTGMELSAFEGHAAGVGSIAFSPDGKRLAGGCGDKTVKLWDLATGQEVLSLKGHAGRVSSVSFSPDGQRLASGTDLGEGAVRVWEATTL
jgi:WD40 repeat protein